MTIRNNDAARAAFELALIALDKLLAMRAGKVLAVYYGGQKPVIEIEKARPGKPDELLTEVARNLALAMALRSSVL